MSYEPFEPEFAHAAPRHLAVPLEQRLTGVAARALGAGILAVVALLWVALASWSVNDPSLTHATSGNIRNLMGPIGAIVSDLLLQTFGLAAIVILAGPLFWGLELVYSGRVLRLKTKLAFLPIAVGVLAGAISALPVSSIWPLNHGYGGILGDAIFAGVANLLALVNAQRAGAATGLLLFAGGFAALSHVIGIAFADVAEAVRGYRAEKSAGGRPPRADLAASPMPPHLQMSFGPNGSIADENHEIGHRQINTAHFDGVSGGAHRDVTRTNGADRDTSREQDRRPVVHYPMAAAQHAPATGWPETAHDARCATPGAFAAPGSSDVEDLPPLPPIANYRPYVPPHPPGPGMLRTPSRGPAAALAPMSTNAAPRASEMPQVPQPQPVRQAPLPPPATEFVDPRDDYFDDATDFDSPSIAARFAPEGAVPNSAAAPFPAYPAAPREQQRAATTSVESVRTQPQAFNQPPMPTPPAKATAAQPSAPPPVPPPHKRNGMFGGLTFRGQGEPTFRRPPLNLLRKPMPVKAGAELAQTALRGNARLLEDVLADFGVKGEIRDIRPGPVVTLYEMEPARGTKSSRVIGLADDIARSMSANAARVAVVPGRNAIGIELPNPRRETVLLRELLEAESFKGSELTLPITLGKSIGGEPVIADLARMPHLLVAGTTGSGKSVGVNAMILSLLYRLTPEECRFIMIDPKMLELSVYNGIPHLLTPVVTDPLKAVAALDWAVSEMEERYKRMAKLSVRNIEVFNNRVKNAKKRGEMLARTVQTGFDKRTGEAIYEQEKLDIEPMPYIVVVIDEFADLMLVAGKEVEAAVQRLAQMARAAGIHIIMATQRPSVDVITGTIKANFPTRISFKVTSKIDSRTILNEQGAEQLLGQGDMLYASGSGQIVRVHGPFVADEEVEAIAAALRENGPPDYIAGIAEPQAAPQGGKKGTSADANDDGRGQSEQDLYDRAVATVLRDRKASTSYIQRRLSIGYNRAADLIERMEKEGVISPANATGKRDILIGAGGIAETDMDAA